MLLKWKLIPSLITDSVSTPIDLLYALFQSFSSLFQSLQVSWCTFIIKEQVMQKPTAWPMKFTPLEIWVKVTKCAVSHLSWLEVLLFLAPMEPWKTCNMLESTHIMKISMMFTTSIIAWIPPPVKTLAWIILLCKTTQIHSIVSAKEYKAVKLD